MQQFKRLQFRRIIIGTKEIILNLFHNLPEYTQDIKHLTKHISRLVSTKLKYSKRIKKYNKIIPLCSIEQAITI